MSRVAFRDRFVPCVLSSNIAARACLSLSVGDYDWEKKTHIKQPGLRENQY